MPYSYRISLLFPALFMFILASCTKPAQLGIDPRLVQKSDSSKTGTGSGSGNGSPGKPGSGSGSGTVLPTSITITGTGKTYANLAAAVAASVDGDQIQIPAGTYTDDFVNITTRISIKGVGGLAHFVASQSPPNGKAVFLVNNDVLLDHLEISGCAVRDLNGAGIKQESGYLTLTNCYFHDNQDGVLTNAATKGITIVHCEFAANGAGDGYSHNLYIGACPIAIIDSSYFHDAKVGHEIKCRALRTSIENCRIQNGTGTASYCIDLPQGGISLVQSDTLEKGPNAQNLPIVHFGGEAVNPSSSLKFSNNLVVNLKSGATLVANQMSDNSQAEVSGNNVFGLDPAQILSGKGTVTSTVALSIQPMLNRRSSFHQ